MIAKALVALASMMMGIVSSTPPVLSASFYNLWASQLEWTSQQWQEDLQYMKEIGIEWAFLTYTSCVDDHTFTAYCWSESKETNKTQVLYNSSNPEYVTVGDDVLGHFLAAADSVGVKVLVGLQLIHMVNVSATAELYIDLATDLYAKYGHFTSFRGFYGTQEWEPNGYIDRAEELGQTFLGPISDHIHSLDESLEFGLSPSLSDSITAGPCPAFSYSNYGKYLGPCGGIEVHVGERMTPSQWAVWWQTALKFAPHFSWLFVQDHRGGQESPQFIAAYYKALAPALAAINVTFWANSELFHITADTAANGGEGNATRTQGSIDRVHRQLLEESPYVQGFTAWEWHWYLSPTGGVQRHRASSDNSLHSNGSLTLYRNYQRTILSSGVALLLATQGYDYEMTPPPSSIPALGALTDGHAYSHKSGCAHWPPPTKLRQVPVSDSIVKINLSLVLAAEAKLRLPFRMVSSFRAYFLRLDSALATMPKAVTVTCILKSSVSGNVKVLHQTKVLRLKPITLFPADSQMVIWDASFDGAEEATNCEFEITHSGDSSLLLAEIEAYL